MINTNQSAATFPLYPAAVCLPIFAGLSVFLCAPPLAWHIKNRNVSCACLAAWLMLLNTFSVINASIWPRDNISDWWNGVGLCDVEVKLYVAAWVGVSGCTASIMRNLARIMNTDCATFMPSKTERRRQLAIELFMCIGFSILDMALVYFVQFNRYYIFSIAGCVAGADNSWLSVVLVTAWPPFLLLVGAFYSILLIVRMRQYRAEFRRMLESSNTNQSRFIRLFLLAIFFVLGFIPVQIYLLYRNSRTPFEPYSWKSDHGPEWNTITFVPTEGYVVFDRWISLGCGYMMFLLFGLGSDALSMYRSTLIAVHMDAIFPSLSQDSQRSSNSSSMNWSTLSAKAKRLFRSNDQTSDHYESFFVISKENDLEKSLSGTQITTTLTNTLSEPQPSFISTI